MPGYKKKSIGKKSYKKRTYKKRLSSMRPKTDALMCHVSLTDNLVLNALASRANVLVNWAGPTNGTDLTFRLANSPEFTRNVVRYRWFRVHKVKITARPLNVMYEFDTARTGGLATMAMASSPISSEVSGANVDALL